MTAFKTVDEFLALTDEDAPTKAERNLIDVCRAGKTCQLGDGERPEEDTPDRRIRATLLRLLITGGSDTCGLADRGVALVGGWIAGELDLDFATARGLTMLASCTFTDTPSLFGSKLQLLNLRGSSLPGLYAQEVDVAQTVFLNHGFQAKGTVNLSGARIGGQLACSNGTYDGQGEVALNAAHINVDERFFWQSVTVSQGAVDISDATIGTLIDDAQSWQFDGDLDLDGFTYGGLASSFRDVGQRRAWLEKGSHFDGEFYPQPYVQLARVFRAMGHDRESRAILAAMERKLADRQEAEDRKQAQVLKAAKVDGHRGYRRHRLRSLGFRLWDRIQRWGSGYGHRPERALFWLGGAWALAFLVHMSGWAAGAMVPNTPVVLTSPEWVAAVQADPARPTRVWLDMRTAPHYETFSAFAYSLDVLLPILNVGQEDAWAPSTATGFGTVIWGFNWGLKVFGWLAAALFAATVGGLLQRDRG